MKIIQINEVYGFGSTGIIVRDLQDICYHNGIECIVAYSQSQDTVKNGYQLGNFISNKIHALLSRIRTNVVKICFEKWYICCCISS